MTKTCGECKYFDWVGQCDKVIEFNHIHAPDKACSFFEHITNGDKIIAGGMRELAKFINDNTSLCPPTKLLLNCSNKCEDCWFNWLNAPAESEENNDTDR